MNRLEELVRDTLADRAASVAALDWPPAAGRRRRSWLAVAAAVAAVLIVVLGLVVFRSAGHKAGPPPATPTYPPAGMRLVSYHGVELAVPQSYVYYPGICPVAVSTDSVIPARQSGPPACATTVRVPRPAGITVVTLGAAGDRAALPTTTTTIAGKAVQRGTGVLDGVPTVELSMPDLDVKMTISGPAVEQILATIRFSDVDAYGCPAVVSGVVPTNSSAPDLVPGRPVSAVSCAYVNWADRSGFGLLGSSRISPADLERLAATLNDWPSRSVEPNYGSGVPSLLTLGLQYRFHYADGSVRTVLAEFLGGSNEATTVTDGNVARLGPAPASAVLPTPWSG